jgi:hypothetical protein
MTLAATAAENKGRRTMAASALDRLRHSQQSARARYGQIIAKREHTMYSSAAAAALGVAEARGHMLPKIAGIDGTWTVGIGALVAANMVGNQGGAGRMLQSLADAMLAIGSFKLGLRVGYEAPKEATKGIGEVSAQAMDALLSS